MNSGVGRAGKVLRRLLKLPVTASSIDDAVIAVAVSEDASRLIVSICDERLAFLQRLKTWPMFGAGWARRVGEVKAEALDMAKATALKKRTQASAIKAAAAGAVIAAGAAVQGAAPESFDILVVVAVVALVAALAWLAWRCLKNR